jgi:PIN domain nuclease of toxin-antitoxin system
MKKMIYTNYYYTEPKLVLDTHTFLWFGQGNSKLTSKYVDIINSYRDKNALYLPAICLWEIALLDKQKRIKIDQPCGQWLHNITNQSGISIAPLSLEVALDSIAISDNFHSDPADRFIVSTARVLNAKLMTRDTKILQYAENGFVQCIEI